MKWFGISWREFRDLFCLFFRNPSNQNVNTRLQNENVPATSGQPEMFDAWMEERALDGLNWEKSMVSMTVRLGFGGGRYSLYNSFWFITAILRNYLDGPGA